MARTSKECPKCGARMHIRIHAYELPMKGLGNQVVGHREWACDKCPLTLKMSKKKVVIYLSDETIAMITGRDLL